MSTLSNAQLGSSPSLLDHSNCRCKAESIMPLQIYGSVTMNNSLCLGIFLLIIYMRHLEWVYSSEVTVVVGEPFLFWSTGPPLCPTCCSSMTRCHHQENNVGAALSISASAYLNQKVLYICLARVSPDQRKGRCTMAFTFKMQLKAEEQWSKLLKNADTAAFHTWHHL